ncbi:MAG: molybdate ABC transporter substrate-binding protein [Planctomycetota bacterium]|nr:molybdate ABC transporter substrate-binding protein [Planctomycetota bacterium]
MRFVTIAVAMTLVVVWWIRHDAGPPGPLVFAASSLTDYLEDAADRFRDHEGKAVRLHFGASAILKRQIEAGAGADLFVSASPAEIDALEKAGRVLRRADLMRNRLVLVERDSRPGWQERWEAGAKAVLRPEIDRVAIGDPDASPVGRYARQALTGMGLWEGLQGRLLKGVHARQALQYARSGEADLAIVYQTDARGVEGLRTIYAFPPEAHSPILYVGAVVQGGDQTDIAGDFLDYLAHRVRHGLIHEYGFSIP